MANRQTQRPSKQNQLPPRKKRVFIFPKTNQRPSAFFTVPKNYSPFSIHYSLIKSPYLTNESLVIYSISKVGRIVPPNKQILRDVPLGFYYGTKIGLLSLNGAGKSTLLRIIAGIDKDYIGEIAQAKGYTYGLLEQDPNSTIPKPSSSPRKRRCNPSSKCSHAWNLDSSLELAMDALCCLPPDTPIKI